VKNQSNWIQIMLIKFSKTRFWWDWIRTN